MQTWSHPAIPSLTAVVICCHVQLFEDHGLQSQAPVRMRFPVNYWNNAAFARLYPKPRITNPVFPAPSNGRVDLPLSHSPAICRFNKCCWRKSKDLQSVSLPEKQIQWRSKLQQKFQKLNMLENQACCWKAVCQSLYISAVMFWFYWQLQWSLPPTLVTWAAVM